MKICILTTSYPTWREKRDEFMRGKFVHDMAKYLVKAGADVHVVTPNDADNECCEHRDGVVIHRFHYFLKSHETLTKGSGIPENIKKPFNKLLVPFFLFFLILNASQIIRKNNIAVINAHWGFPTGYIGLLLKRILKRKLVITLYGAELFPYVKSGNGFIRYFLKSAIRRADAIAGISDATVRAANEISGRDDIVVIPDGIDTAYYIPGRKNLAILSKYGCSNSKTIFFTGRMVERKGHRTVLEAMETQRLKNMNVKLLLGGNGPLFQTLYDLRSRMNLEECVHMPGFLPEDELVPILQSVDLHVLPSCVDSNGDTEGSATAAFEAMACGTPSIVSRIGGNEGAIENGKGAFYFEAGNSPNLAEIIVKLMDDQVLLERAKREARKFIEDNYSWEASVTRYFRLIGKMY